MPLAGGWLRGRAPRSHRGGHWFKSSTAHHLQTTSILSGELAIILIRRMKLPSFLLAASLLCLFGCQQSSERRVSVQSLEPSAPGYGVGQHESYASGTELEKKLNAEVAGWKRFPRIYQGNAHVKEVALTFDDGPHPKFTPTLLEILKKENVKATFFVVGRMVELHPDLVKAENEAGHDIENHTFSHPKLPTLDTAQIVHEWEACNEAIKSVIGVEPKFCRPPGGEYNNLVLEAAHVCGLTPVFWTVAPKDFRYPTSATIRERVLGKIRPGGIILFHDGIPETMAALPDIIETLRKEGYQFVTISELAKGLHRKTAKLASRKLPRGVPHAGSRTL
jgi:peptidoglycan/xylan/chitin deacetylase (PgdA/CDA1 family)